MRVRVGSSRHDARGFTVRVAVTVANLGTERMRPADRTTVRYSLDDATMDEREVAPLRPGAVRVYVFTVARGPSDEPGQLTPRFDLRFAGGASVRGDCNRDDDRNLATV